MESVIIEDSQGEKVWMNHTMKQATVVMAHRAGKGAKGGESHKYTFDLV